MNGAKRDLLSVKFAILQVCKTDTSRQHNMRVRRSLNNIIILFNVSVLPKHIPLLIYVTYKTAKETTFLPGVPRQHSLFLLETFSELCNHFVTKC